MKRPLTLVIAAATAALAIAPLGLGTQAQAQVDINIGKQKQPQLPFSTGPSGDRDNYDNRRGDNYDNRRGDRYDQYGNRYTRDRDRDGAPDSRDRNDYNPYRR